MRAPTTITSSSIETSDTWFAAWLLASRIQLLRMSRGGQQVSFTFGVASEDEADALYTRWLSDPQCHARALAHAYTHLLAAIKSRQARQ